MMRSHAALQLLALLAGMAVSGCLLGTGTTRTAELSGVGLDHLAPGGRVALAFELEETCQLEAARTAPELDPSLWAPIAARSLTADVYESLGARVEDAPEGTFVSFKLRDSEGKSRWLRTAPARDLAGTAAKASCLAPLSVLLEGLPKQKSALVKLNPRKPSCRTLDAVLGSASDVVFGAYSVVGTTLFDRGGGAARDRVVGVTMEADGGTRRITLSAASFDECVAPADSPTVPRADVGRAWLEGATAPGTVTRLTDVQHVTGFDASDCAMANAGPGAFSACWGPWVRPVDAPGDRAVRLQRSTPSRPIAAVDGDLVQPSRGASMFFAVTGAAGSDPARDAAIVRLDTAWTDLEDTDRLGYRLLPESTLKAVSVTGARMELTVRRRPIVEAVTSEHRAQPPGPPAPVPSPVDDVTLRAADRELADLQLRNRPPCPMSPAAAAVCVAARSAEGNLAPPAAHPPTSQEPRWTSIPTAAAQVRRSTIPLEIKIRSTALEAPSKVLLTSTTTVEAEVETVAITGEPAKHVAAELDEAVGAAMARAAHAHAARYLFQVTTRFDPGDPLASPRTRGALLAWIWNGRKGLVRLNDFVETREKVLRQPNVTYQVTLPQGECAWVVALPEKPGVSIDLASGVWEKGAFVPRFIDHRPTAQGAVEVCGTDETVVVQLRFASHPGPIYLGTYRALPPGPVAPSWKEVFDGEPRRPDDTDQMDLGVRR